MPVREATPAGAQFDWAPVIEVIELIAAIEDAGEFGIGALRALAEVVPFDLGSFNEVDPDAGRAFFCAVPDVEQYPSSAVAAFPGLVHQNPILQYQRRTGDGSARRISDFLSAEEFHELDLYQDVYALIGVEYQVALGLVTKEPLVVAFALSRGERDFSDEELAVLDALRPHLIQAYRNVHALAVLGSIDGALAAVGQAVIVLGPSGPEGMSEWASSALAEHFGPAGPGGLPPPVADWVAEERQDRFANGQPRIRRPLASTLEHRQLVLRLIPSVRHTEVVVLEERRPEREAVALRRLGLTARQADILSLLVRGEPVASIGVNLGITPATVNKHLQHIYRRLGVSSRTAATATAFDALLSWR